MNLTTWELSTIQLLASVIPGFEIGDPNSLANHQDGMVVSVRGRPVSIAINHVRVNVVEDALARLSMGFLQARNHADKHGTVPLTVVVVPSLGNKTVTAARNFMANHLPGAGWAIVDRAGNARVFIPELNIDIDRPVARVEREIDGRTSVNLFSDLNRWLLKILLLADASENLWGGPRRAILSNAELSRVAGVSPEMVRRFVKAFHDRDFLRQATDGLHIVRRTALLDLWKADDTLNARPAVPARRLLAGSGSLSELSRMSDFREVAVVAGFEACRQLGILHASVPGQIEVYVSIPISEALSRFGMERCSPSESDIWIIPTRHTRSILGGRITCDGMPVVDAFQAALDVLRHPGRGPEQSDYIINELLRLGESD